MSMPSGFQNNTGPAGHDYWSKPQIQPHSTCSYLPFLPDLIYGHGWLQAECAPEL